MIRPTAVEPVKLIRRTAGWSISAPTTSAASSGALVTRLTTPSGKPASAKASTISACVRGQRSDALRITVLPQASGRRDRAAAEDHRRVPRRDAEDTPTGSRSASASEPGLVRRDDLAGDLGGQRRRLAHHAGAEHDVEPRPRLGRAQLLAHRLDERVGARFERVRGGVEQRSPRIRAERRPGGEGGLGGFGRSGSGRHRSVMRGPLHAIGPYPLWAAPMNPLYEQMATSVFERMSGLAAQAWRGQPRPGLSRFRLARRDPRRRRAGAEGRLEPICAVARAAGAARGGRGALRPPFRPASSTADHVCVTSGATEALGAAILATVEPGDEVIIFTPAYDSYAPMIRRAGGDAASKSRCSRPDGASTARRSRRRSTPKTRAILFNNPHNPAGRLFDADELEVVAAVAREHDLIVISDEVWEHILLDGRQLHAAGDACRAWPSGRSRSARRARSSR